MFQVNARIAVDREARELTIRGEWIDGGLFTVPLDGTDADVLFELWYQLGEAITRHYATASADARDTLQGCLAKPKGVTR